MAYLCAINCTPTGYSLHIGTSGLAALAACAHMCMSCNCHVIVLCVVRTSNFTSL